MKTLVNFINEAISSSTKCINEMEFDGYEIYLDGNSVVADDRTIGELWDDCTVEINPRAMKRMHWNDDDVIKMLGTVAGKNGWPDLMYYTDSKGKEHDIEEI